MKSTANVFQIILPLRRSRRQASNNPLGRLILALAALVVNPSFIPPAQAAGSVNTGLLSTARDAAGTPEAAPAKTAPAIPWDQLGAKAGADYRGDGLTVTPTAGGARLHCVFQRLDGEATREGLWLTSTVTNQPNDRFRVTAAAVGRQVVGNTQRPPRSVGTRYTAKWGRGGTRPYQASSCSGLHIGGWPDGALQPAGAGGGILGEHGWRAAGLRRN